MQILTKSLIDSTRKASRFLQRDFTELEMIQSSISKPTDFVNRSLKKVEAKLKEELAKHSYPILNINDVPKIEHETAIVIVPMDSILNFSKSLPFFGSASFVIRKNIDVWEATNIAIHFPALSEIYYAEKGGSTWVEKHNFNDRGSKLRVSGCRLLSEAVVACNSSKTFNNKQNFNLNSILYTACIFIAGKLDCISIEGVSHLMKLALELLIREAGGIIKYNNRQFIASNYPLIKEFENLFSKNP